MKVNSSLIRIIMLLTLLIVFVSRCYPHSSVIRASISITGALTIVTPTAGVFSLVALTGSAGSAGTVSCSFSTLSGSGNQYFVAAPSFTGVAAAGAIVSNGALQFGVHTPAIGTFVVAASTTLASSYSSSSSSPTTIASITVTAQNVDPSTVVAVAVTCASTLSAPSVSQMVSSPTTASVSVINVGNNALITCGNAAGTICTYAAASSASSSLQSFIITPVDMTYSTYRLVGSSSSAVPLYLTVNNAKIVAVYAATFAGDQQWTTSLVTIGGQQRTVMTNRLFGVNNVVNSNGIGNQVSIVGQIVNTNQFVTINSTPAGTIR